MINIFNRKGSMQQYSIDYSNVQFILSCILLRERALETLNCKHETIFSLAFLGPF